MANRPTCFVSAMRGGFGLVFGDADYRGSVFGRHIGIRSTARTTAVFTTKMARPNYTIGYPVLDE